MRGDRGAPVEGTGCASLEFVQSRSSSCGRRTGPDGRTSRAHRLTGVLWKEEVEVSGEKRKAGSEEVTEDARRVLMEIWEIGCRDL